MKKLLLMLLVVLFLGSPGAVLGEDVYDDFKGDGSVTDAPDSNTACTPASGDAVKINARAACVENLASSTHDIIFRCDANPVRGTGTTLRAGLAPGEKTCFDVTLRHTQCGTLNVCGANGTSATYTIRWIR